MRVFRKSNCPKGHSKTDENTSKNGNCKVCAKESRNSDAARIYNRTVTRRWFIQRRYCLSLEQYETLLTKYDNKCHSCKQPFEETPHIDHDHKCCPFKARSCGKCVRGLLCSKCNKLLGYAKDSIDILQHAVTYLTKEA